MNEEFSKVIMTKSRLRNKHLEWPSREIFLAYRKVKNKCHTLTRKPKKDSLNTLPRMKTMQQERHSGTQSDLLLQTNVQYQIKT